ncbi:redoxin domain-containing protein [Methylicorpusculum oleiharenae]|uniref:redoxin domain-containing protein n=1 Tax=Methylicorpusculum oleiharenae TaxID=1338687 RepID=UPI00135C2854|nr:redoxin domain-containing protein [Methylicorpusculum oleiharenae]MCD2450502.1 redoxin domain-containing protein [Methylicorpusculum oleiharenae]
MNSNRFSLLAFLSVVLAFVCTSLNAEPLVDKPAPLFSGAESANGSKINLADLRGKTVVLEWTNHECPFVVKHYQSGNIPKLQKIAADKGYVWIQVISSAPGKQGHLDGPTAQKLNDERGATPANTLFDHDGTIGKLYGATNTPQLFIIDPEGILVYKGGIDSIASADQADIAKAQNYISAAFDELAAGKKVSQSSTKPYGCTVKYAS